MGRKKVEINTICGERLSIALKEAHMDQKTLAAKLNYTQQHISGIINGKRNMSPAMAEAVSGIIPSASAEWLLGLSDYRSDSEKAISTLCEVRDEWRSRLEAVQVLAYLAGYEIDLYTDGKSEHDIKTVIQSVKEGYKIRRDGEILGYCKLERFNLIALECQELVEHRIKSYLREVSGNG